MNGFERADVDPGREPEEPYPVGPSPQERGN